MVLATACWVVHLALLVPALARPEDSQNDRGHHEHSSNTTIIETKGKGFSCNSRCSEPDCMCTGCVGLNKCSYANQSFCEGACVCTCNQT